MVGLKTLVVALVILIIAAIIISPGGIEKAGGFFKDVENWLGLNIGGIMSKPTAGGKAVSLSIEPPVPFTLKPNAALNATSGSIHINGFSGEITIGSDNVSLSETGTGLNLALPANGTMLSGLRLDTLSLNGVAFYISPNITTTGGNITLTGFYGSGTIDSGRLSLDGNVSSLKATIGGVSVEV